MVEMSGKMEEYAKWDETNDSKWWNRQGNMMNKQNEMKEIIRSGGKDREIWWISKLKWKKPLKMAGKTVKMEESAQWDDTND
jgi:hypothetical protein